MLLTEVTRHLSLGSLDSFYRGHLMFFYSGQLTVFSEVTGCVFHWGHDNFH